MTEQPDRKQVVLIVEDDPDQLLGLKTRLEASGYKVVTATTVRTAVDVARKKTPNVIIMDLGLPDGDGFGAVDQLQAKEETRQIPVIILTAAGLVTAFLLY